MLTHADRAGESVDWSLSNGLAMRRTTDSLHVEGSFMSLPAAPRLTVHAPFALYPSPVPLWAFVRAYAWQPLFNKLVHAVANDSEFLDSVVAPLAESDLFVKRLYDLYVSVRDNITQPIVLGIHRSDYLLHESGNEVKALQQVELNTISASFACLSSRVTELHRHRHCARIEGIPEEEIIRTLPANNAIVGLAETIYEAYMLYHEKNSIVVFLVQPDEKNIHDQRLLEYHLIHHFSVPVRRFTMIQVAEHGCLKDSKLFIQGLEIAIVYYRAGYGPEEYLSESEWDARRIIEQSCAIKCPTIAYQLAGLKKIQQVLANPGVVEKFVSAEEATTLRQSFTGLYSMDDKDAIAAMFRKPDDFVLKPQREGGGHNIYGKDIPSFLKSIPEHDWNAYILMDMIRPPINENCLVRLGHLFKQQCVSELGVYGGFIAKKNEILYNRSLGHLLRTKSANVHEGGVAAGFAVLDSPKLVD